MLRLFSVMISSWKMASTENGHKKQHIYFIKCNPFFKMNGTSPERKRLRSSAKLLLNSTLINSALYSIL